MDDRDNLNNQVIYHLFLTVVNGVDQKSAIFWELLFYTDASLEVVNLMMRVHTCM